MISVTAQGSSKEQETRNEPGDPIELVVYINGRPHTWMVPSGETPYIRIVVNGLPMPHFGSQDPDVLEAQEALHHI